MTGAKHKKRLKNNLKKKEKHQYEVTVHPIQKKETRKKQHNKQHQTYWAFFFRVLSIFLGTWNISEKKV